MDGDDSDDDEDEDEDSDDETTLMTRVAEAVAKAKPTEDSDTDIQYYEVDEEDLKGWLDGDDKQPTRPSTAQWSDEMKARVFGCALDEAARSCISWSGGIQGKGADKGYNTRKGKGKGTTLREQVEKQGEKIQELLHKTNWLYKQIMLHKEKIASQRHELDWWHKHGKWQ